MMKPLERIHVTPSTKCACFITNLNGSTTECCQCGEKITSVFHNKLITKRAWLH